MTISGGVSINGLLQGLPQGQDVIAQMTIAPSTVPQPQLVQTVLTTATAFVDAAGPNGVLIIPPAGNVTALSICTSGGTAVIAISPTNPTLISLTGVSITFYLIATGSPVSNVQAIFF